MPGLSLRTRAVEGGELELELAFDHPMESGERADGEGARIPSWYLERVALVADDEPLAELVLGPAVARNPVVTLALPSGLGGATLRADWEDSRGERGSRTLRLEETAPPAPDPARTTDPAR